MARKTHSKPLSLDITDVRKNRKKADMAQAVAFDNLDSAIVYAHKLAHTCGAKVIVRGRKGNLHYMCDGNF